MNLEDHLGDVLRKARLMNDVPAATVADAAGLSVAELGVLEEKGVPKSGLDLAPLAALLRLKPAGLRGHIQGWLPASPHLSQWQHLRVFTTDDGGMAVNCYLVWDGATRDAALFDTGWNANVILETIQRERLNLCHICVTHSHHDHVAALAAIREIQSQAQVHSNLRNAPAEQRLRPGGVFELGRLRITHRNTPGHAEDGVTYVVTGWPAQSPAVAIVGDAIFAGSMGGAPQRGVEARKAIHDNILSLPEDTLICPGHGPLTTVGEEKQHNPFF